MYKHHIGEEILKKEDHLNVRTRFTALETISAQNIMTPTLQLLLSFPLAVIGILLLNSKCLWFRE